MSSSVDIANQALTRLGADRIISFNDETTVAKVMSVLYEPTKRSLLRMYPWNCATRRAKLAQLAEPPVNEFTYQYSLPENCLRVLEVWSGEKHPSRYTDGTRGWKVEGKRLLTDYDNIYIRFIEDVVETEFDPHVEEALVAKLAFDASYTIQASNTTQTNFATIFGTALEEAKTTDNMEMPHTTFDISRLRNVRY